MREDLSNGDDGVSSVRPEERVKGVNKGRLMLMRHIAMMLSTSAIRKATTAWCNSAEKDLETNAVLPWDDLHRVLTASPEDMDIVMQKCPSFAEYVGKKQSGLIVAAPGLASEGPECANDARVVPEATPGEAQAIQNESVLISRRARGIYSRSTHPPKAKASGESK